MQMETVIETQGLSKHFGGKRAVDRLNLAVPRGAICALLGDNGAGKTTTIRMLTGLLRADAGKATILGQDCWSAAAVLRRRVAYVPEKPRYYDWMTVAEIGWFTGGFHGRDYLPRFNEWLGKFQLEPTARLNTLSKGQYAKVGLALALAIDPEVLVLDEPTSGLDLLVRHEFLGSMVGLAAEGRTIVISSHQISEVERVASHVAFISGGRLLLFASMDDLRRRIVRLKLRWDAQPPDPATLGTVLQRNGAGKQWQAVLQDPRAEALASLPHAEGIHDVEVSPLHLEDIYFALLARKEDKK
jgi:ABC-2 type transport system ATP-binding protein